MKNKILFPFLKLCYKEYKPYFFTLIFNFGIILDEMRDLYED